jgi:hypothetical protein
MFKKLDTPDIPKPSETSIQPQSQTNKPKTIFDFMNENKITFQQIQSELTKYNFNTREINIFTDLVFNKMNLMQVGMRYNVGIHEIQPFKEKTINMILSSCKEAKVETNREQIEGLIKNIIGV